MKNGKLKKEKTMIIRMIHQKNNDGENRSNI